MCVCVCVCVRERERERERDPSETQQGSCHLWVYKGKRVQVQTERFT